MFNIFKRKYKRSDWLEGLMAAEKDLEACGFDHCQWAIRDTRSCGLDYYIMGFADGYQDYLDYFENNLKNL